MDDAAKYVMVRSLQDSLVYLRDNDGQFNKNNELSFNWGHVREIVSNAAYHKVNFRPAHQIIVGDACDVLAKALQAHDGNSAPQKAEYETAINDLDLIVRVLGTMHTKQSMRQEVHNTRKTAMLDVNKIALALLNFDQRQNDLPETSLEALDEQSRKHYLAQAQAVFDIC